MRYKRSPIIIFSSLTLCVFLLSVFNISKANNQSGEVSLKEEAEAKAVCLVGKKVKNFPFYVYRDADSGENNFFPTGNMGDIGGAEINIFCKEYPYAGSSCVKIVYKEKSEQAYGWAGLYWQYPPNNWGNIPNAYDLTGARRLTFWARGKYGGEVINKFQVGGIAGKYRDSGVASIGPVILSKQWKKYTINLNRIDNSIITSYEDKECWPFMKPLSRIIGGFCWATSLKTGNNQSITFYIDEIRYE
ncbi:MAG: hypothetical protein PHT50_04610 [Candidatus Omnitrophica bacterium]|nr:hypothetical protein [Candidatus Omnitrophota bacterium]